MPSSLFSILIIGTILEAPVLFPICFFFWNSSSSICGAEISFALVLSKYPLATVQP